MALGKRRKAAKPFIPPKLQITSMMDMFTIILIFLLFSFSNNPEQMDLDSEMSLPQSTSKLDYKDSIRLVLSKNELKLDGNVVATLENDSIVGLETLYDELKKYRDIADELKKNENEEDRKEHILFLCDKEHSFKVVNAIVKTAGRAGYPNFQFAVVEKD
ncbi:MAG: biopolymer transporter ExbD [Proteobacteria bacterium]|nr:biopolymer transporter ExbD [Pseudomonadota bacterium]